MIKAPREKNSEISFPCLQIPFLFSILHWYPIPQVDFNINIQLIFDIHSGTEFSWIKLSVPDAFCFHIISYQNLSAYILYQPLRTATNLINWCVLMGQRVGTDTMLPLPGNSYLIYLWTLTIWHCSWHIRGTQFMFAEMKLMEHDSFLEKIPYSKLRLSLTVRILSVVVTYKEKSLKKKWNSGC